MQIDAFSHFHNNIQSSCDLRYLAMKISFQLLTQKIIRFSTKITTIMTTQLLCDMRGIHACRAYFCLFY